jgi:hypothetical protein
MNRRPTLVDLRWLVLLELDDAWVTPTELADRHGLNHGRDWLMVALVLERLANDGLAELKQPGSRTRRFRRGPA